jgi:phage gpG-like protein
MKMLAIKIILPDLYKRLQAKIGEMNLFMAALIQTNRGMLFDSEGARNGHKRWKPLRLRDGMPLSNRGNLRKSISPFNASGQPGPEGIVRIQRNEITVGTKLAYAYLMNWGTTRMNGGVMVPTHAKALMIPLPAGKKIREEAKPLRKESTKITKGTKTRTKEFHKDENVIFRKKVRIPERRFDEWNAADQMEFDNAVFNKLKELGCV